MKTKTTAIKWERFEERADDLRVSIDKKGSILIGAKAVEKLGSPEYVEFLYDSSSMIVGLKPAKKSDDYAYPVRKRVNERCRLVRASKVLRTIGIHFDHTRIFIGATIDENGVLVLDLTNTKPARRHLNRITSTPTTPVPPT